MDDVAYPPYSVLRQNGEQLSKEDAQFKKGKPFHRCGLCTYYDDHKCRVVAGYIDPYMGCRYFRERVGGICLADSGEGRS